MIVTTDTINNFVKCSEFDYFIKHYEHIFKTNVYHVKNEKINNINIVDNNYQQFLPYLIWYTIYNQYKTIMFAFKTQKASIEFLNEFRNMFSLIADNTCIIKKYNRKTIELNNNNIIFADALNIDNVRGKTIDLLFMYDVTNIGYRYETFLECAMPCICSNKNSNIINVNPFFKEI